MILNFKIILKTKGLKCLINKILLVIVNYYNKLKTIFYKWILASQYGILLK